MEVIERTLETPVGRFYCKSWAMGLMEKETPLILLHDSLGSVGQWREFPVLLAQHLKRPIIAYDRIGYGHSDRQDQTPDHRFIEKEAAQYFPALKAALGLQKYALLGHSVGGAMALTIAGHDSDSCVTVVSESAQAFVEDRTIRGIRQAQLDFQKTGQIDRLRKWHGERTEWVLKAWTDVWLSEEFSSWSLEKDLGRVRCPTLIIHGDGDEYGSLAFPEMMSRHLSAKTQVEILEETGHIPHREKEELVLKLVAHFFEVENID